MKKFFTMMLLAVAANVFAQFQTPVTFTVKENKISDNEIEVVFSGKVAAGWHVYGTDIPDGGPTKAELTLEKKAGVKALGGLKATGKLHRAMDPMFEMEISYMEGTASFSQRFALTGGDYDVAGYLTFGACNDVNCIPPTDVEFAFKGTAPLPKAAQKEEVVEATEKGSALAAGAEEVADPADEELAGEEAEEEIDTLCADTTVVGDCEIIPPSLGEMNGSNDSLLWVFFLGVLGGLAALVTPCVWPIIPMTVSFFLKRSKDDRGKGIRDAVTYGISIVVIYVTLGLIVTLLFGASALNALSTNAIFNIFFCLLLVFFGASFLGGFEITLPSSWSNAVDSKAGKTTGLLSIFLMAFTLSLVSFSCTGPIIGFLLVEMGTSGSVVAPTIGMLGFAIALALPFTLFALFPSWIKKAPKSGNWMNCIKVCLGFLELAFSLKFLSVADLAYGWHILDREVFLCLWIVLFALMGAYLIGWIRFAHDEDEYDEMGEVIVNTRTSVVRFFMALAAFAFALYMVPGLWGAPCKAVSAFAPPMNTQDFNLTTMTIGTAQEEKAHFTDLEEGLAYAKEHGKPVMIDFTGYGCVNCRKMEASVWTAPEVKKIIDNEYILISLYVDDKTPLPEKQTVMENGSERTLRTVGDKWSYYQRDTYGSNAQPFYVLVDVKNDGALLNTTYSYNEDVPAFVNWLETGLKNFKK